MQVENATEMLHSDLERIHDDFSKMTESFQRHVENNNMTFSEISKSLITLSSSLEVARDSISDLKKTSENLVASQNQIMMQFSLIDQQGDIIKELKTDNKEIREKVNALENIKAEMKGSYRMLVAVLSIITFVISTSVPFVITEIKSSDKAQIK